MCSMAFSSESIESCVLRKHYKELCEIIQNADYLALDLYSEGLICRDVRDEVYASTMTTDKNRKLLAIVERIIRMNPDQFHEFLQILQKEPYLRDVVEKMKASLSTPSLDSMASKTEYEVVGLGTPSNAIITCDILKKSGFSSADWEALAPRLGVTDTKSIWTVHPRDPFLCLYDVISQWLQGDREASWVKLANEVSKVECYGPNTAQTILRNAETAEIPPPIKRRKLQQPVSHSKLQTRSLTVLDPECIDEFLKYLYAVYTRTLVVPDSSKWPCIRSKSAVHLACIRKEKMSHFELDEFTRDTIHGNIDDIVNRKEAIEITEVAKVQEDGAFQNCVLIEGAPGVGKTTFACMLCKRWIDRELLLQYSLVILLRLRDRSVREAKAIADLFRHSDKVIQNAVAMEVEKCHGDGVAFIFEGFDELPLALRTENSIILQIIRGDQLPLATKIVTSRPSATSSLQEMPTVTQHVEILGFRKEDIKTYVNSELSSQESLLNDFRKYCANYPHISSMMYIPLNCAIVVEIYKIHKTAGKIIPKTSTELYMSLTKTLLLRHLYEHPVHGKEKQKLLDISQLPPDLYQQFGRVCKIAYDGVIEQQLVFSELPSDFENFGIMHCIPELYADTGHSFSHNFLHLTVQEFLAAYHLYVSTGEYSEHFRKHCNSNLFKKALTFLAGLTKFQGVSTKFIQSMILSCSADKFSISLDGLHWLFEAQNEMLVGDVLKLDSPVVFRPSQHLYPHDCYTLGYCIAHSHSTWEVDLSDSHINDDQMEMIALGVAAAGENRMGTGSMTELVLRNNLLTSECLRYLATPCFLQNLVYLDLSRNKFDSSACSIISRDLLPLMPKCRNIYFSFNKGGVIPLLTNISSLTDLEEIGLYNARIGHEDIKALCGQLPSMQNLAMVEIGRNELSEESIQLVVDTLLANNLFKNIKLAMSYNQLAPVHVSLLAKVLRTIHNLEGLYLQGCGVETEGACELASALCTPDSKLRFLSLNENHLEEKAGMAFAKVLQENTSLVELRLVRNNLGLKAVQMLVNSLKYNNTLKVLKLSASYKSSTEVHTDFEHRVIWQ